MTKFQRWLILFIVSSALFVIVVDVTVLYTALPKLTHELHATVSEKLWILNAYTLLMAGLLFGAGTLGDRVGHKKLLSIGLIIFGFASLVAAFSSSATVLIVARVLLAIGASMMMPSTLSIIRLAFSEEKERVFAIGVWAAIAAGGAALGPLIGGILLEHFWWGSVFFINIPIVIVALILTHIYIPSFAVNSEDTWDFVGSLLIMIGLIGVVYALKEFGIRGGNLQHALLALTIGVIFIYLFVKRQEKTTSPLIDFSLFRNINFSTGVTSATLLQFSLVGVQFILTQRLQLVLGYTPFQAGLYLFTMAMASFFGSIFANKVIMRLGALKTETISFGISASGLLAYIVLQQISLLVDMLCLGLFGIGIGVGMAAASSAIMNNVVKEKAGMAASIEEVSYEFGSILGVAIVGSAISFIYSNSFIMPESLSISNQVLDSLDDAILIAEKLPLLEAKEVMTRASNAFDKAFTIMFYAFPMLLFVTTLVFNRLLKRQ